MRGLVTSLGGIGLMVAGFVIILRKGPLAGGMILLVMAALLFLVSLLSAIVNWKKNG